MVLDQKQRKKIGPKRSDQPYFLITKIEFVKKVLIILQKCKETIDSNALRKARKYSFNTKLTKKFFFAVGPKGSLSKEKIVKSSLGKV